MPEAYLGDPERDLLLIEEADILTAAVLDPQQKRRLDNELQAARQLVEDWIESRAANVDFTAWRRRQGRPFSPDSRLHIRTKEVVEMIRTDG